MARVQEQETAAEVALVATAEEVARVVMKDAGMTLAAATVLVRRRVVLKSARDALVGIARVARAVMKGAEVALVATTTGTTAGMRRRVEAVRFAVRKKMVVRGAGAGAVHVAMHHPVIIRVAEQ
jgi:hypothetical protein